MQENKYSRTHIGKTYLTNQGYEATVVDGGTKVHCCTIQIEAYRYEVSYDSLKVGSVKYPFHKTVQGKGYTGIGKYSSKKNREIYCIWKGVLERCYDAKFHKKRPTYKDATVCDEWLDFQNFAKWAEENFIEGYELDKDLLVPGNKKYSPETCVYIPQRLNSFLTNIKSDNTSGYVGVSKKSDRTKWAANIKIEGKTTHLGMFTTAEEASIAYQEARVIESNKLKELYKDVLPSNVLNQIR